MRHKILVLLAAYNGEKYIAMQIDSILNSNHNQDVSILIGLDPSTDKTESILENLDGPLISIIKNITPSGSAKNNFSRLTEQALNLDSNYFCFSDQDDLWDKDKITITLEKLIKMEREHGPETPLLVFSDSRVVSETLQTTAHSFIENESLKPNIANDFKRLLIQNVGQGCSFLFNKALLELATPIPDGARMHDHWLMLVACAFGKISFINQPLLSYRQHSSNVLGSKGHNLKGSISRAIKGRNAIKKSVHQLQKQAKSFHTQYKNKLPIETQQFLLEFGELSKQSVISRKKFCLKNNLYMGDLKRTIGFYVMI
ncbi:hypothetical protein PS903_02229 [Pseudomonas fluorescens]|nr:hypothetical protein PS903_02229 [Pseudomonas fluorescens]